MGLGSNSGRVLAALWVLTFASALQGQHFTFQRYGEKQGLTNLVITDLLQDNQGYIWAGTFNGLFRYDGTSFERFGENEGISTDGAISLVKTSAGELWGVTDHGLYHLEGNRFRRFDLDVHLSLPQAAVWLEDSSHFVMATDKGLATASFRDGKLGPLVFDLSHERTRVSAVYAAVDGGIWYSIASGVCRTLADKTVCSGPHEGLPKDRWTSIRMDRNGDVWVRSEKRLYVQRKGTAHFDDGGSSLPPADGTGVLSLDREGNIFVPTQGGLARMVQGHWRLVTMREGLTSNSTELALEDQEGSLWVGHLGGGLERWCGYGSWEGWTDLDGLENSSILAIQPMTNGDLYLGTDRGLLRFRPGKGTLRSWLEADGLAGDHVFALAYDQSGDLCEGSSPGGISCLDIHTGRISRVYRRADTSIAGLARDRDGSVWAATAGGLLRFTGSCRRGFHLAIPPGAPATEISGLLADRAGRVWAASDGNLHVRIDGKWSEVGPSQGLTGAVLFIAEADDGSVLVLNAAARAFRLTEQYGHWRASPLPSLPAPGRLVPYFIGSDRRNAVWVGTDRGVFVLEPANSGWRWHDEDDGLVWNDTNIGAFAQGTGRDLWIGTSRGLAHYTPSTSHRSVPSPRTLISAVQVNGQPLQPSHVLKWRYPATSVQFKVTALTFLNESRTRFLYRCREIDQSWQTTESRVITYSYLRPGTYTFDVLAESTDGVVGREPASITLVILPPWYQTRLFLAFSGAAIFLLAVVGYRWRTRSFRRRERELESAVVERTAALDAERRLEQNQHHVLELIASGVPLEQIFTGIAELVESRIQTMNCSVHHGSPPTEGPAPGFARREICDRSAEPVGWIDFNYPQSNGPGKGNPEKTLAIAIRLACIAIESAGAKDRLSYQANHDSLTGLPNRLRFQESLRRASAGANKTGEGFALLYIDLDGFKQINDRYGHRIGDLYLQEISSRFRSCIRKGDLLARLGGDEFAAILYGANSDGAERTVKALRQSMSDVLVIEDLEVMPRASIGFSLHPDNGTDAESLLRTADEAMYRAKLANRMSAGDRVTASHLV